MLIDVQGWTGLQHQPTYGNASGMPMQQMYNGYGQPSYNPSAPVYYPGQDPTHKDQSTNYWDMDIGNFGSGLTADQHHELMETLQTDGMEDIQGIIAKSGF